MGNLVFGSGAEPGRASKARGGLIESPMERDYDATESERERYKQNSFQLKSIFINVTLGLYSFVSRSHCS